MGFMTFKHFEKCENKNYLKHVKDKIQEGFELRTNTPKSVVSQQLLA